MWWFRLRAWTRRLFSAGAVERSMDDELRGYLREDIGARIASGMNPADARRTALAHLGGVEPVKEQMRQARVGAWLDSLRQDVRYAARALAKAPGFSASVIGSLSLGIAAVVAGFAFTNATMFRPFHGVVDQHRLIELNLGECSPGDCGSASTTLQDYEILRPGFRGLRDLSAISVARMAVALPEARTLSVGQASDNYFDVLGARPALGRTFSPDERQVANAGAVVLAHRLWRDAFGADPSVIGRTIRVADQRMQIVGVAGESFGGVGQGIGSLGPDLWVPIALADSMATTRPAGSSAPTAGQRYVRYIGRLAPGADIRQIQAEADVVTSRLPFERQGTNRFAKVSRLWMHDPAQFAPLIAMVMAVPILVLVIACVNVANLLLARGSTRGREIAVRLAIGAGRPRLIRQLLVESVMLALAATAASLPLVWWGLRVAQQYLVVPMPVDLTVFALALLTATASAVAFGLVPAFRATSQPPARALNPSQGSEGTRGQSRVRRGLVVVQVALSLGLLATGSQLVAAMKSIDRAVGTPPDRLLIASFDLNQLSFPPEAAAAFYEQVLNRVSKLPQVEAAGVAPPRAVWVERYGKQEDNTIVVWRPTDTPKDGACLCIGGYAAGGLVEALGLRVIEGRAFTGTDRLPGQPAVVVVNRPFADKLLEGRAIGRVLRVAAFKQGRASGYDSSIEARVVGVIEPAQEPSYTRDGKPLPAIYVSSPLRQEAALSLYVRSRESAIALIPAIRQAVHEIDGRIPFVRIESLAQLNDRLGGPMVTLARAAAVLGVVALVLAAWGLYAVVSYIVATRSREIAVRLALGARPRTMLGMVLRQAMTLAAIGIAIGGVAAFAIGKAIQAEIHAVAGTDVLATAASAALLTAAMLIASSVPAVRASRVDPMTLLKDG